MLIPRALDTDTGAGGSGESVSEKASSVGSDSGIWGVAGGPMEAPQEVQNESDSTRSFPQREHSSGVLEPSFSVSGGGVSFTFVPQATQKLKPLLTLAPQFVQ